ncbi:MAG: flagellar protein [Eubacterium sp.]|nr:flagellar protein [Eubacterium sp.]
MEAPMNIEQIRNSYLGTPRQTNESRRQDTTVDETGKDFNDYLSGVKEKNDVHFSKHASKRLDSREIELTPGQRERLNEATDKARDKGLKESLVMVDNLAFIVNVKNNTVVTAVNDTEKSVFTNIDGAIIG